MWLRNFARWLFCFFLFFGVLACARHHVPSPRRAAQEGVSVVYDAFDYPGCAVKKIPRLTSQENGDGVPVDVFPEHLVFSLQDKRPLPALNKGARYFFPVFSEIKVIPLFDPTVKDFSRAYPGLSLAAQTLKGLLQKRPDLPAQRRDIPDIAEVDCERAIISHPQFLDFASGSGLLFLTQYGQDFQPINNEELACVFQGLSADGRYYVAARLALGHPTLDRGIDVSHPVPAARQARYLQHIQQELDYFPESSFNPPLTDLKTMMASLAILGVSRTAQTTNHPPEVSHGSSQEKPLEKSHRP